MINDNISTSATSQDKPGQSYYLKLGRKTIHGLSHEDLESLYDAIDDYFDREDEIPMASEDLSSDLGECGKYKVT